MRLRAHAVPEQRHRSADGQLAVELDGERVHRDRPDDLARLAVDAHLGARQVAAEPVGVADRNQTDPRRTLRHEPATIACALSHLEQLHLCEPARPVEHRLEPVGRGVLAERREPVQRDAAARRVVPRLRDPEGGGAARDVADESISVRRDELLEALELPLRERVGGREMAHQADDVARGETTSLIRSDPSRCPA